MKKDYQNFEVHISENQLQKDYYYYNRLNDYFAEGMGTNIDKLRCFPKYVPIAEINRFLAKSMIFQKVLNIQGSIVECGIFFGGGLMTWATLSSIFEPLNHTRKVIGFDTFGGFVSINEKDKVEQNKDVAIEGGLCVNSYEDLQKCIEIYDGFRPLGHIPKVQLVKGDVAKTMPDYLTENQHLIVSLLYLDFDLYEPTKIAIETILPRMPKGSVIAFDQLNIKHWTGETLAVLDTIGIKNLKIERFDFQPQISFATIE